MKKALIVILCIVIVFLFLCCGFLVVKNIILETKLQKCEAQIETLEKKVRKVDSRLETLLKKLGYNPLSYEWNVTTY